MDDFMTMAQGNGYMKISVISAVTNDPIEGARISISSEGNPSKIIRELITDSSGQTEDIMLPAPPVEYSLDEQNIIQPFSEYNIIVTADNYYPVSVSGSDILSGELSLQGISLTPRAEPANEENIVIPFNTLFGDFPPKIAEAEIKPVSDSGEIVLSRVVIPEYIVVHDGAPTDSTAQNYYVRYRDYIKNVASSEIYSTWPDASLRANILAIMSFTLNRVYTEWYRNRGYDFTITSSTAFDHKWVNGRNIFENISQIVDEMFNNYLSRPNVKQPILTQYCDGKKTTCPNWMSQWGSKYLADEGYSAIEILRYYYGDSMYINTAEEISGVPASWPGEDLQEGSRGNKVAQLQEELNSIRQHYNAIPYLQVDGIYGPRTKEAVAAFQKIFDLPESGITDFPTWYKISDMYVRLSRIAELN